MLFIDKYIKKIQGNKQISKKEQEILEKKLNELKNQKINIMVIGGTGVGKSSTINAIFKGEVAKVGINPSPETMNITKFSIPESKITIWDSPGLGDGVRDEQHKNKIIELLHKKDEKENMFIDCVLVIVSASSKDLGTEYKLINEILIPNLGKNPNERIIVAINKADEAISERYWDTGKNQPSQEQKTFLKEKVIDIQNRIYESTNVDIKPMYYKAGYRDEREKDPSYNIDDLMMFILKHIPRKKAGSMMDGFGENKTKEVEETADNIIVEFIKDTVKAIADIGKSIWGWFFG